MISDPETKTEIQINKQEKKFKRVMVALLLLSFVFFLISISIGRAGIANPISVIKLLLSSGKDNIQMFRILQNIFRFHTFLLICYCYESGVCL